jgi:ribonuclease E
MAMKMLIDATHAEETRVVVTDGTKVEEFDFEAANRRQLAGNIYLAKITRVEPSLQAAFVDYGGNRHGFLAFSEIHPDYYQIPVADRKALLDEERAYARQQDDEDARPRRGRRRDEAKPEAAAGDAVKTGDAAPSIPGMDVVDLDDDADGASAPQDHAAEAAREGDAGNGRHDHPHHDDHGDDDKPYAAVDHAADIDDQIESIADEDVSDEVRPPRKPRARRYKIQEVVKVRQIMLVQVVKEERGNKGAALTTYLSLAGRYCVLMPNTARGGGISRKITNAVDRKKLKEIAQEIEVPEGAGLIVRTAGAKRTKAEIKRDYEYLMRLWEQIRDLTLKSIAPAPIYEEGNLIKRSIRDLYSREIDEVLVEGEAGYRTAKDFMKMIMPSHAKNVKHYTDPMPLFARHQVESYLGGMFNPTVQLRSGGYIVIGITEALVAIDVNSGRATKEGSIEETALKTNLEAAEEIARQLRLRDLAGLIVIDFIDMEERRNNAAVEKKLKDKLKTDRARIQVGRISGFGLLEMSRQRLRPGMLEATTQPCPHCHGTGLLRSDDSQALAILRQIEEEGTRKRTREVLVRAPVGIINFLMNNKREHIALIELRYGMAVRLEADPALISPDYVIEKFKTATRPVPEALPVVSGHAALMPELDEDDVAEADEAEDDVEGQEDAAPAAGAAAGTAQGGDEGGGRRKRRRRRRRRGGNGDAGGSEQRADGDGSADEDETEAMADDGAQDGAGEVAAEASAEAPRRRVTRGGRSRRKADPAAEPTATPEHEGTQAAEAAPPADPEAAPVPSDTAEAADGAETPAKPKRRSRRKPAAKAAPEEAATAGADGAPEVAPDSAGSDSAAPESAEPENAEPVADKPKRRSRRKAPAKAAAPAADAAQDSEAPVAAEAVAPTPAPVAAPEPASDTVPEAAAAPADPVQAPADEIAQAPEPETREEPSPEPVTEAATGEGEAPKPASEAPRKRGWWAIGRS